MAEPFAKRVELWVRRQLLRRWNGPAPTLVEEPTPLLRPDEHSRILFLRQDRIGDVLVSIPLLRLFHTHFPAAQKELLLSHNNWGAVRAVRPYVQRCWRYDKRPLALVRLLTQLRRQRYDIVIDLTDNPSVTSSVLLELAGAPVRLGIAKGNDAAYTHVVPSAPRDQVHIVERLARLLLPFGIDPAVVDLRLDYPLTPEDRQWARALLGPCSGEYRVGVNIAASHPSKYWGRERWGEFLRALRQRHPEAELLLFASPAYGSEQRALAQSTGARPAPLVPSFHAFAALLEQCHIIVTPDTAAVHLAAAWQRPCVVLYVWDRPDLMPWLPYRSPYEAVYTREGSVQSIPVEAVLAAFERLLQHVGAISISHA